MDAVIIKFLIVVTRQLVTRMTRACQTRLEVACITCPSAWRRGSIDSCNEVNDALYYYTSTTVDPPNLRSIVTLKANSGASSTYIRINDQDILRNIHPTTTGPTVRLPDNRQIKCDNCNHVLPCHEILHNTDTHSSSLWSIRITQLYLSRNMSKSLTNATILRSPGNLTIYR